MMLTCFYGIGQVVLSSSQAYVIGRALSSFYCVVDEPELAHTKEPINVEDVFGDGDEVAPLDDDDLDV